MRFLRPILAILIGVGLIVLLFVLIFKAFAGPSGPAPKVVDLMKYSNTTSTTELFVDGPVNDDPDHRTVRIAVSQSNIQIDLIQGYQNHVIQTKSYPNNPQAYAVFMQSLARLNFTKGDSSAATQDERGYCATGDRYIYKLSDSGSTVFRFWSTSCNQGTFKGERGSVQQLFYAQVPSEDFDAITADVPLS